MARKKKKQDNPDALHLEDVRLPKVGFFAFLRARFFAGIVIAAPIAITIWVTWSLIALIDKHVKPLIPPQLNIENYTQFAIPGFGVLVAVLAITLLGAVATNLIGRSFLRIGDRMINSIPYVRSVYRALKQIFETFANQGSNSFKEVVLIEYPKRGSWCIGFLAASAKGEVAQKLSPDHVAVFVPTTPNPTSGFLMYVPESEIKRLAMSIEDGAKLIISGGLVSPTAPSLDEDAAQGPRELPIPDPVESPAEASPDGLQPRKDGDARP